MNGDEYDVPVIGQGAIDALTQMQATLLVLNESRPEWAVQQNDRPYGMVYNALRRMVQDLSDADVAQAYVNVWSETQEPADSCWRMAWERTRHLREGYIITYTVRGRKMFERFRDEEMVIDWLEQDMPPWPDQVTDVTVYQTRKLSEKDIQELLMPDTGHPADLARYAKGETNGAGGC